MAIKESLFMQVLLFKQAFLAQPIGGLAATGLGMNHDMGMWGDLKTP